MAPRPALSRPPRARVSAASLLVLAGLILLPAMAISRGFLHVDWLVLACAWLGLSVLTFFIYGNDKWQAAVGGWRVPEMVLHGLTLLGGWPGALLGQWVFRHKTAKVSFQMVFWSIVLLHQVIALNALLNGRLAQALSRWMLSRFS